MTDAGAVIDWLLAPEVGTMSATEPATPLDRCERRSDLLEMAVDGLQGNLCAPQEGDLAVLGMDALAFGSFGRERSKDVSECPGLLPKRFDQTVQAGSSVSAELDEAILIVQLEGWMILGRDPLHPTAPDLQLVNEVPYDFDG